MASIDSNPFLSIQINSTTQKATVVVVAQVSFAPGESPLTSRVDCRVLGDDVVRDDFLFGYPTHFFNDPGAAQSVRFEKGDVPLSQLNEDLIGADEIVGEVTLRPGGGMAVSKRTNVFQLR
ncbi:MAG: hypothetical protein ABI411_15660 [Tahibacter sp.]